MPCRRRTGLSPCAASECKATHNKKLRLTYRKPKYGVVKSDCYLVKPLRILVDIRHNNIPKTSTDHIHSRCIRILFHLQLSPFIIRRIWQSKMRNIGNGAISYFQIIREIVWSDGLRIFWEHLLSIPDLQTNAHYQINGYPVLFVSKKRFLCPISF